jgi:hypothetical protein
VGQREPGAAAADQPSRPTSPGRGGRRTRSDDGSADYGSIGAGATVDCYDATGDCLEVSVAGTRPAAHWDATFDEVLSSGVTKTWTLHVGESFPDVPVSHAFYSYVENLFHNAITGGCGGGAYCPGNAVTRGQMAVFLLKAEHGRDVRPAAVRRRLPRRPLPVGVRRLDRAARRPSRSPAAAAAATTARTARSRARRWRSSS